MKAALRLRLAQTSLADIESDFQPHETAAQFRRRLATSVGAAISAGRRDERLRVLIIDDSLPFREAARALLERRGYQVTGAASTAAAGLERARRLQPDCLLVDVRLPDATGFEVAASLSRSDPRLAILLTSSDDHPSSYSLAERAGARGFVLKSQLASCDLARYLTRG